MVRSFYRSWWRRPFWVLVMGVVVPLVVGRIVLTPLLERLVHQHLDDLHRRPGMAAATFSDLDVFLFPPSFTFRDVVVRGPAGESLEVDRLEIHLASLEDLRGSVPHVRLRMVHPVLKIVAEAGEIGRWIRALPAARIDVTTIENGTLNTGAEGQPLAQALSGDIENLFTGTGAVPAGRPAPAAAWQTWMDGRLDGVDPVHALFKADAGGTWEGTLTVQQSTAASPPSGSGPVALDIRVKGAVSEIRGVINVSWPGSEVPVAVAQDRINRLSDKWPTNARLTIAETRAGSGAGSSQGLQLAVVASSGTTPQALNPASFQPFDAVGLTVDLVRLANGALLPPAPAPPSPSAPASLGVAPVGPADTAARTTTPSGGPDEEHDGPAH